MTFAFTLFYGGYADAMLRRNVMSIAREVWANRKWHHIWCPTTMPRIPRAGKTWACRRCDRHTVNRAHQALTICHASPKMKQNYTARAAMGEST